MELWIRSQDKDSLIKAEKIELIYDYLCSEDIQLIHIETDKGRVGSYSTKERALEVLDDIEKFISIRTSNNGTYEENDLLIKSKMLEMQVKIYNMPKE